MPVADHLKSLQAQFGTCPSREGLLGGAERGRAFPSHCLESGASRRIFPAPPFSPSACASAASRNGIRRPIGRTNFPSLTSSANSRSLDGSGCARTRVILTVGFLAAALSGNTAV